jgi:hypothetical protein
VLELEGIPRSRIGGTGLKSGWRVSAIPLAIADGQNCACDAAIRILYKRYYGMTITQHCLGRRLGTWANIPLIKAGVVRIDRKQRVMNFPLADIGRKGNLRSRHRRMGNRFGCRRWGNWGIRQRATSTEQNESKKGE